MVVLQDASLPAGVVENPPPPSPEASCQTSLTFSFTSINFNGELLSKKRRGSVSVELRNVSHEWLAYKIKCTHYYNMTVKPHFFGILEPGEVEQLFLVSDPHSTPTDVLKNDILVLETFFLEANLETIPTSVFWDLDVIFAWERALESDLTRTKLDLTFLSQSPCHDTISEKYVVHLDRYPDQLEQNRADNYKKVLEQIKYEKIPSQVLLLLVALFFIAYLFGLLANDADDDDDYFF